MIYNSARVILLRESLVSVRVFSGLKQSVVIFLPECWVKFRGYDMLVLIRFYQVFIKNWET